jgi:WD40 repeat protein
MRRHRHERHAAPRVTESAAATAALHELQSLLEAEVQRLPDKYRIVFVLCCQEGRSRLEAARDLGWKEGTVAGRLARARQMLQTALARRGVALAAALTAGTVSQTKASAAIPTVRGALAFARGEVEGIASVQVLTLANGVLRSMALRGTKTLMVGALTLSLLISGFCLAAREVMTAQAPEGQAEVGLVSPAAAPARHGPGDETTDHLDRFGDPLPLDALARMGTVRYAQGDCMDGSPVLAPDHKTFATVSKHTPYGNGRVVCLWDAATGKELRHLHDPDFEPYQVFFLKKENLLGTIGISRKPVDGKTFAHAMQFWDPATGRKAPARIEVVGHSFEPWALSPDDQWLASAGRQPSLEVRERKTGKLVAAWPGHRARVTHLAFAPDGRTVAICCGNFVRIWNWRTGDEPGNLGDFEEDVERLWYSPDGRWLAASIGKEGVRVWKTTRLGEERRLKGEHDLRFSPDGKRLVSTATGKVWDVASGKELGRFEDCSNCLVLEFSPDGKSAMGYALGRLRRWDAVTGKDRSPLPPRANRVMIHQLGFLPGGKTVVSASPDGAVRLWDAATGNELRTLVRGTVWNHEQPAFMRVAPDGTIVEARGSRLSFFKGEGLAEEIKRIDLREPGLASLSMSPDGKCLVLAWGSGANRVIQLWDLPAQKFLARFTPPEATSLESLAPSFGQQIAAFVGHTTCLLNAHTGVVQRNLMQRPAVAPKRKPGERMDDDAGYSYFPGIQALAFSPQGDLLASAGHPAGGLRILDVVSGKTRHELLPPAPSNPYELHNVGFSPDGRMLASESEPGVVDVWETSSGRRRRRFRGHRSYQTTLAFSPDGGRLATGNRDATILVWDVFGVASARAPATEAALTALWDRLLESDAECACLAMGRLMRCPDLSVPFLKQRLLGRKSPEAVRLQRWIADLDSDEFARREQASAALAGHLAAVEPLLKAALAGSPSVEMRRRIERLLQGETRPPPPETLRDLRALEVLEHLGPGAVGEVARQLAAGNYDPWVAAEARATLHRLATNRP